MLLGLLMVNLYISYDVWSLRPNLADLKFPNGQSMINSQPLAVNPVVTEQVSDDFDYEVIGYRASSGQRSSVVLKKNNQEYVIQEGELLDNRYTLTTVEKDKITFSASGRVFEIENRVGQ